MSVEKFSKAFGIYHWDTFDNETILIGEADTLVEAQQFVQERYKGRLGSDGADRVDIVDQLGEVVDHYSTR
jgi:hypothetical protein